MRTSAERVNPRAEARAESLGFESLFRALDRDVFALLALMSCAALGLVFSTGLIGADSWLSLLAGRTVLHDGLPHRDLLTIWGDGRRWVDQQWLAHVGMYVIFRLGGLSLLVLATLAATLSSIGSLVGLSRRRGASPLSAAIVVIPLFLVILPATSVRAQTFAYPLFAVVVWILWGSRIPPSPARLAMTLPILVLWANVHGSVLLGAVLVTLAAAEAAVRRRDPSLIPLAIAPTVAALASPYGFELVRYYRKVLVNPSFGKYVTEWQAPTIRQQALFFLLALVATALIAVQHKRFAASELIAFALTTIGGFFASRNIVWFALLMLFLLPRSFDIDLGRRAGQRHPRVNVALISLGALVVVVFTVAAASRTGTETAPPYRPAALDAVRRAVAIQPRAPIWSDDRFADWLLFDLPSTRGHVLFDVRFELLTPSELLAISDFRSHVGANWSAPLRGVGTLIVRRSEVSNARELVACRGGRLIYSDADLLVASLNVASRAASPHDC
jgi:hypothetical protein